MRSFDHFDGLDHDGRTYRPGLDRARLNAQQMRVYRVMQDRVWRTLAELSALTGDPEASVSARLRDLRKERFGAHQIDRRRRGDAKRGLHEYRIGGDPPVIANESVITCPDESVITSKEQ